MIRTINHWFPLKLRPAFLGPASTCIGGDGIGGSVIEDLFAHAGALSMGCSFPSGFVLFKE